MEYFLLITGTIAAGALIGCVYLRYVIEKLQNEYEEATSALYDDSCSIQAELMSLKAKSIAHQKANRPIKDRHGYFRSPMTGQFVKKPKMIDPIVKEAHDKYKERA
jgi:hypothetical protein